MTEKQLLEWLIENIDASIKKAEYKYSRFDAYSETHDCFIELKCRRKHYVDLMIEKKKFDSLVEDGTSYYICSTPKGIYCWELSPDTEIEWITKMMPKTTDFGKNKWIEKEVGFLKVVDAKKLK